MKHNQNTKTNYLIGLILWLLIGQGFNLHGQERKIDAQTLSGIYTDAMNGRLDLLLMSGHKYLEKDSLPTGVELVFNHNVYHTKTIHELVDMSLKQKKSLYFLGFGYSKSTQY